MLALFSSDPRKVSRLRSALAPQWEVVVVTDWRRLESTLHTAECAVVHVDQLAPGGALVELAGLRARHPRHPVVLVTRWDLENARHLKDVWVTEVIWLREIESALPTAVERACARTPNPVHRLATVFEKTRNLPGPLRRALSHACRSERPVRSIKELTAVVGRDRRTLWHQWDRALGSSSSLRLQDFLHWILLLRALARKTPERTWTGVARDLGLHPSTLGRYARQLTGYTLPDLVGAKEEIVSLFRERVLTALIGTQLDVLQIDLDI